MKLTGFCSAVLSSALILSVWCSTSSAQQQNPAADARQKASAAIEQNKISPIAIDVSPAPNDTFRITAKHVWKMKPGLYRKGHLQEVLITDQDAQDFALYFVLTNRQEESVKKLNLKNDFETYLRSTTQSLLAGAKEKEIKVHEFSPIGQPGFFTVLHSREGRNPAKHAFPVIEAGVCKISENTILTFVFQHKMDLAPETRIDLYKLLAGLGKEDIADQRSTSVLATTQQVWNAAVEKFQQKLGADEFSKQYPFSVTLRNNQWIISGQSVLPDAKKPVMILKLSAKDGYEVGPAKAQTAADLK